MTVLTTINQEVRTIRGRGPARIRTGEKNRARNATRRGRPKGQTGAATAVRDVQICRLLARGMTMRAVAQVFGVNASTVMRARDRQVAHLNMRLRERKERAQRVERRGRPRKAS